MTGQSDGPPEFETDTSGAEERRQSPRLAVRLPLRVCAGSLERDAMAAVVSGTGAMLLSALIVQQGDTIELRRPLEGRRASCRVVWCGGPDERSHEQKYGVVFEEPQPGFWGLDLS